MKRFVSWVEKHSRHGHISPRTPVSFLFGLLIIAVVVMLAKGGVYLLTSFGMSQTNAEATILFSPVIVGIGGAIIWFFGAVGLDFLTRIYRRITNA